MFSKRLELLLWVFFIHLAGIHLFIRGFLLTRLSLDEFSNCSIQPCSLPPTHKRAVFLIIDALRFDFLAPNPPQPPSEFYHNVLTLPRELTAAYPRNSFLFNAYADPPTSTLQRIKALTTGSLPTFVDIGNNFGASSIEEDSILKQLRIAGKRVAFMGDDTWMQVFPDSFEPNMTFPYDSFNVEDLHTVDEGVIRHIFPLLEDNSKPFDFLIGHFLGVDHVGHRVGPDHPNMKAKLQQMNDVLKKVVDSLEEDTLLVVLGDHGMDRSGDHGGDGVLETSSALWIYSKGPELTARHSKTPSGLLNYATFPETAVPHRSVQQIDILPTISLLLGLPIPFNNLGTVIPELFWRYSGEELHQALHLNAAQVNRYLNTYRSSSSGGELDEAWDTLQLVWASTQSPSASGDAKLVLLFNYTRVALSSCRAMWAQFNPLLMALGLSLLSMSLCATWAAYSSLSKAQDNWDNWLTTRLQIRIKASVGGAIFGIAAYFLFASFTSGISFMDYMVFSIPLASTMGLIVSSPPEISLRAFKSTPILLVIHAIAFFSNSFTFWEDRITNYLLVSSIVPCVLKGFTAPTARLRYRILGFSALFALCVRLIAMSTVCREEQQPYCNVTFYASSALSSPPTMTLALAIPLAMGIPLIIRAFLRISRSDAGVARPFLPVILTPSLLFGTGFWIVEWADSANILGEEWSQILRVIRTWLARTAFGWIIFGGFTLWYLVPLAIDVDVKTKDGKRQVIIVGFANAFGSPYVLFWTIFFSLVYTSTQLTGQVVLALSAIALISYLEVLDSVRDVKGIEAIFTSANPAALLDPSVASEKSIPFTFTDVIPIALLGMHAFYATGHQATISSLQWKSAFLLNPVVVYPFSAITVALNSLGPLFLMALAAPLLALWNRAPLSKENSNSEPAAQVKGESTLAALSFMTFYATLLLGTAVSASILRRHLMVWKVFAPRFMMAFLDVLVVDIAVIIGVGLGVERIAFRVSKMFRDMPNKDE